MKELNTISEADSQGEEKKERNSHMEIFNLQRSLQLPCGSHAGADGFLLTIENVLFCGYNGHRANA